MSMQQQPGSVQTELGMVFRLERQQLSDDISRLMSTQEFRVMVDAAAGSAVIFHNYLTPFIQAAERSRKKSDIDSKRQDWPISMRKPRMIAEIVSLTDVIEFPHRRRAQIGEDENGGVDDDSVSLGNSICQFMRTLMDPVSEAAELIPTDYQRQSQSDGEKMKVDGADDDDDEEEQEQEEDEDDGRIKMYKNKKKTKDLPVLPGSCARLVIDDDISQDNFRRWCRSKVY